MGARRVAPGSDEAVAQGCICPRIDNGYGRGYMGGILDPETNEPIYVMFTDCPVHGMDAMVAEGKLP